jgi:hypothetical protein
MGCFDFMNKLSTAEKKDLIVTISSLSYLFCFTFGVSSLTDESIPDIGVMASIGLYFISFQHLSGFAIGNSPPSVEL